MQSNSHYFEISINNKENLEKRYMCLQKDKNIIKYRDAADKINSILEKMFIQKQCSGDISDQLLDELTLILEKNKCDKNRFNCFLNACDCTEKTIRDDKKLLKDVVELFLDNRKILAVESEDWIQALIDKGSSRKLGKIGEQKLSEIAENSGFTVVNNWSEMDKEDYAVAVFKKGIFDLNNIKKHIGAEMPFKMQGKMLDIILKNCDKYIFIEAKHIKESGGSQDKQIKELIETISVDDKNQNIYYGAFLDGVYSNILIGNMKVQNGVVVSPVGNNKILSQQQEIAQSLNIHKRSYWLNTAGFSKFVEDFRAI